MTLSVLAEPANTVNYMIAGFAVIFVIMLIYLVSLAVRNRNLHRDLTTLEELDKKS